MRRAARVDANQADIVAALRQAGCSVLILSAVGHGCPDILAARNGVNVLIEIKTPDGRLTDAEIEFVAEWRGPVCVVRSVDEALRAVGAL